jgi:hypothetical protein
MITHLPVVTRYFVVVFIGVCFTGSIAKAETKEKTYNTYRGIKIQAPLDSISLEKILRKYPHLKDLKITEIESWFPTANDSSNAKPQLMIHTWGKRNQPPSASGWEYIFEKNGNWALRDSALWME